MKNTHRELKALWVMCFYLYMYLYIYLFFYFYFYFYFPFYYPFLFSFYLVQKDANICNCMQMHKK